MEEKLSRQGEQLKRIADALEEILKLQVLERLEDQEKKRKINSSTK